MFWSFTLTFLVPLSAQLYIKSTLVTMSAMFAVCFTELEGVAISLVFLIVIYSAMSSTYSIFIIKMTARVHSFFYREHVLKEKTLGIAVFQREHFTLTIFMENQNKEHIAI